MLGFFDKKIWNKGIQIFNAGAFTLALYSLATDPEAKVSELGLDLVAHAYSLWCLNNDTRLGHQMVGYTVNTFRMGEIYSGVMSGITRVPLLLAAVDAVGHMLTARSILFNSGSDKDENAVPPVSAPK